MEVRILGKEASKSDSYPHILRTWRTVGNSRSCMSKQLHADRQEKELRVDLAPYAFSSGLRVLGMPASVARKDWKVIRLNFQKC